MAEIEAKNVQRGGRVLVNLVARLSSVWWLTERSAPQERMRGRNVRKAVGTGCVFASFCRQGLQKLAPNPRATAWGTGELA